MNVPKKEIHHFRMHIGCRFGEERRCDATYTLFYTDGTSEEVTERDMELMERAIDYYAKHHGTSL
jgi:hypothetical protein